MNREFQVEDYLFSNKIDADKAKDELDKIRRLEEKIPGADPEILFKLYNKCIENRTFVTPVGFEFMKKLKNKLENYPQFNNKILPIPMYTSFEHSSQANLEKRAAREAKEELRKSTVKAEENSSRLRISLLANLVLVIMIIIMFVISLNSSAPNILNYKKVITNQYSEWEESLTQREKAVREKERELNINISETND